MVGQGVRKRQDQGTELVERTEGLAQAEGPWNVPVCGAAHHIFFSGAGRTGKYRGQIVEILPVHCK